MTTVIAFSGSPGDCIYVDDDLATVTAALSPDGPGFARFTQIPTQGDAFSAGEVLVNTDRVAFVRAN